MQCKLKTCSAEVHAKDLCASHYWRFKRYGDFGKGRRLTQEARFWKFVEKGINENDCWKWLGNKCSGYGHMKWDGKTMKAHRISHFLHKGFWAIPFTLHTCDNPECCNPKHLYAGTPQNNVDDMISRNRYKSVAGERHGKAFLTEQKVLAILSFRGERSQRKVARQFQISQQHVSDIWTGKKWKHLHSEI